MKYTDYILELLDRYFDGNATLAEEQTLRQYFASDLVDPELEGYREMFRALNDITVPDTLADRLDDTIGRLEYQRLQRRKSLRRWCVRFSAVAASVALILAVAIPSSEPSDEDVLCGMTPAEVAAHATRALEIMSRTINAGSESANRATTLAVEIVNNQNENI